MWLQMQPSFVRTCRTQPLHYLQATVSQNPLHTRPHFIQITLVSILSQEISCDHVVLPIIYIFTGGYQSLINVSHELEE